MSDDHPQKMVNGELLPLTDEEIAQRRKDEAEWRTRNPEPKEDKHERRRSK
jgi:hypothetical protein